MLSELPQTKDSILYDFVYVTNGSLENRKRLAVSWDSDYNG